MKRLVLIAFALMMGFSLSAQILDDSTTQVYGSQTLHYFLEQDLRDNQAAERRIDTLLDAFHQYSPVQRSRNYYQDLGNLATALRPVFYELPSQIGTRLGIEVYQPYLFTAQNVAYFDTKSPYTQARYAQGNLGDQLLEFQYTQNVNPNWNLGFHYKRLISLKQFGAINADDRNADHLGLMLHTSYQSENGKYRLLYHFAHLNQQVSETGGVFLDTDDTRDSLFTFELEEAVLGGSAASWQSQNNHHLYQAYALDSALTLFHILNVRRQRDNFDDVNIAEHLRYYTEPATFRRNSAEVTNPEDFTNFDPSATSEGTIYRQYENTLGIRGKLSRFNYEAYLRNQFFDYDSRYSGAVFRVDTLRVDTLSTGLPSGDILRYTLDSLRIGQSPWDQENFVGGRLFYQFADSSRLSLAAELMLGKQSDYDFRATWQSRKLILGFRSMFFSPTLVQRGFVSNHFIWGNSFLNTLSNEITGSWQVNLGKMRLRPSFRYQVIDNHIYFGEEAQPLQSSGLVQLANVGLELRYRTGKLRFESEARYTRSLDLDLIRIPEWFGNARLLCEDCFLSKLLNSQIGLEFHYKSAYFADGYMPVSKQFFLQNDLEMRAYPIVDVFLNFKIKTFRGFLKLSHLNQGNDRGYQVHPSYPGYRRAFTFGIQWNFFD